MSKTSLSTQAFAIIIVKQIKLESFGGIYIDVV